MKKPSKLAYKNDVSEDEIMSQYRQGFSSNMIAEKNGINVACVSKILRDHGIQPRAYRKCPDFIKRVIHALILAGFSYTVISSKTHVAHNYIREYVSQTEDIKRYSQDLFRRKSNQAVPPTIPPESVCPDEMVSNFRTMFENGEAGFCMIVTTLGATEEQIVYLFSIINNEMLEKHGANLTRIIWDEVNAGIPTIGASRKLGVSPSYVANVTKK